MTIHITEYQSLVAEVCERLGFSAREVSDIHLSNDGAEVRGAIFRDGDPFLVDMPDGGVHLAEFSEHVRPEGLDEVIRQQEERLEAFLLSEQVRIHHDHWDEWVRRECEHVKARQAQED